MPLLVLLVLQGLVCCCSFGLLHLDLEGGQGCLCHLARFWSQTRLCHALQCSCRGSIALQHLFRGLKHSQLSKACVHMSTTTMTMTCTHESNAKTRGSPRLQYMRISYHDPGGVCCAVLGPLSLSLTFCVHALIELLEPNCQIFAGRQTLLQVLDEARVLQQQPLVSVAYAQLDRVHNFGCRFQVHELALETSPTQVFGPFANPTYVCRMPYAAAGAAAARSEV